MVPQFIVEIGQTLLNVRDERGNGKEDVVRRKSGDRMIYSSGDLEMIRCPDGQMDRWIDG